MCTQIRNNLLCNMVLWEHTAPCTYDFIYYGTHWPLLSSSEACKVLSNIKIFNFCLTHTRKGFSSLHAVKCTALFIYVLLICLMNHCYFFFKCYPVFVNCRTSSSCVIYSSPQKHDFVSDIIRFIYLSPRGAEVSTVLTPLMLLLTNAAQLGHFSLQRVRRLHSSSFY